MFVKSTRFKQVCQLLLSLIVVFYIERHQTLFLGDMYLKGHNKEISNFLTKTMD